MNKHKQLNLNKFNMKTILNDSNVLIIGKRRSGKSFLIKDLFYHKKHISQGIVFSGTEHANPFFGKFIPDTFIHPKYDSTLMETIFNKQSIKIKKAIKKGAQNDGKNDSNNTFIVLDDMLSESHNWKRDEAIKTLFFNGRHYNVLGIITLQYVLGIPPDLRGNVDYVFIFNTSSIKNKRTIYEQFCGMIPTFDEFCDILNSCTQNHECMVVQMVGSNTNDISDQIFWYKAEEHPTFRVGSQALWDFHNKQYKKNYEDDNNQLDENFLKEKQKNNKLKLFVNRLGEIKKVSN